MSDLRVVIVGGVAGGASAATRLRRLNEKAKIVILEKGPYVSFANCGLPYHIGGRIKDRKKLLLQTPQSLYSRFRLDVRTQHEALKINLEAKTIEVKNLVTGEVYAEPFDKLILSPGASPIRPPLPGHEHALTLRNLPDMDAILEKLKDNVHKAVVIGGGFIGLEMAENLHERGVAVSVVEAAPQVMVALDPEMAALVHQELQKQGVALLLGDPLARIESEGRAVVLQSGKTLEADLIILAIGVRPDIALAKEAGLEIGARGGIAISQTLQTSHPDVYAVGDAAEKTNWLGQAALIPLAWAANRQGRLVADHIMGRPIHFGRNLGTAIAKVFDLTVASTGLNEKTLQTLGKPFQAIHIHPSSHASYYPGSQPISLKLLFEPQSGEIYGAQAVGQEGTDKRIDVLATAIKAGIRAQDLADLELSYAPPYSSAKDPVNMLGYVAQNVQEGLGVVQWHQLDTSRPIVDVRNPAEFRAGHIQGAQNIPLDHLRERLAELPTEAFTVYCQVGLRGYLAMRMLRQLGFSVQNLDGGFTTFSAVRPEDTQVPEKTLGSVTPS